MKKRNVLILIILYLFGWYVNTSANYAYWIGWTEERLGYSEGYMERRGDAAFSAATSLVCIWWPVMFFTTGFYKYGFEWRWYKFPPRPQRHLEKPANPKIGTSKKG